MSNKHAILQKMVQEMPYRFPMELELYVLEAMDIFATAVAEDVRKRAAEQAKILVSKGETHLDIKSYTLDGGVRFSPDYARILSTEINLDL